jgi:uncharacterized membrane protein YfcA
VQGIKAANMAVRFLLELCMLAAFAYWGSRTGESTAVNVALAVAAPLAAATVWGVWMAPKSSRRLPERRRIPLEFALFGLAVLALVAADAPQAAAGFGVAAAVNTTLVHVWGEDAREI